MVEVNLTCWSILIYLVEKVNLPSGKSQYTMWSKRTNQGVKVNLPGGKVNLSC